METPDVYCKSCRKETIHIPTEKTSYDPTADILFGTFECKECGERTHPNMISHPVR